MKSQTRLLVTGSRDWTDYTVIQDRIYGLWVQVGDDLTVVQGGCPTGADKMAVDVAMAYGFFIEEFPADWSIGRSAGPIRNQQMVDSKPSLCYAFIKNNSRGATHCANAAKKAGIPTVIFRSNPDAR